MTKIKLTGCTNGELNWTYIIGKEGFVKYDSYGVRCVFFPLKTFGVRLKDLEPLAHTLYQKELDLDDNRYMGEARLETELGYRYVVSTLNIISHKNEDGEIINSSMIGFRFRLDDYEYEVLEP